jgi:hypothetical protein
VGSIQVNEEEQHGTVFALEHILTNSFRTHTFRGQFTTVSRGTRPQRVFAVYGLGSQELDPIGYPGASRRNGMPTTLQRQRRATSPEPRAP